MNLKARFLAPALSAILVAVPLTPATAGGGEGSIPKKPLITDIAGDANYVAVTDMTGLPNHAEADLLAAWFERDGNHFTAFWHVAADPVDQDVAFAIRSNPSPDAPVPDTRTVTSRCLTFTANFPAEEDPWDPYGRAAHGCENPLLFPAIPKVRELADGSVLISTTYRMGRGFPLNRGDVLTRSYARSGTFTVLPDNSYLAAPLIDTTANAPDYVVP